jgi:hypothetical protein
MIAWIRLRWRQFWCGFHTDHGFDPQLENWRIFNRCPLCGYESRGWDLYIPPPRPQRPTRVPPSGRVRG